MDDPNSGGEKKVRRFATLNSDATQQDTPWIPQANPIPPSARPRRATSAEMQTRVAYCIQMLMDGRRDHEVKKFFRNQYGVGSRQTQTYLLLARKRLAETNNLDIDQIRSLFYARYLEIYRKAENYATKIAALRAAAMLYGVEAPQKVAETTVDGKDKDIFRQAVMHLTLEQLRALRDAKKQMERIASGETVGDN